MRYVSYLMIYILIYIDIDKKVTNLSYLMIYILIYIFEICFLLQLQKSRNSTMMTGPIKRCRSPVDTLTHIHSRAHIHTRARAHTHTLTLQVSLGHTNARTRTHTHTHIHTHTHTCTHTHTHTHTAGHSCTHTFPRLHHKRAHLYIVHTYIHTCIHTYTHTQGLSWFPTNSNILKRKEIKHLCICIVRNIWTSEKIDQERIHRLTTLVFLLAPSSTKRFSRFFLSNPKP